MFRFYIVPGSGKETFFKMYCENKMINFYTIEHHAFRVRGRNEVNKVDIYDIGLLNRIRLRKEWNVLKGA